MIQTPRRSRTGSRRHRRRSDAGRSRARAGGVAGARHRPRRRSRLAHHRTGELTLAFDEIVVDGRSYPLRANAVDTIKSEGIKGEVGKIAAGAGVGAIVGGIIGGTKGAITGILIGAGGTIAATEGKDVELPAGTLVRIRLEEPVTVAESSARYQ